MADNYDVSELTITEDNFHLYSNLHLFENLTLLVIKACNNNTINISNIPNLIHLSLVENNDVNNVIISSLPNLVNISIVKNVIMDLKISNLPSCSNFICYSNNITHVDIDDISNIELIYINNNSVSSLKITKCPLLHGIYCSDNNLVSISLENTDNVANFECSNNKLQDINLYCLPQLRKLKCNDNQLSFIDTSPTLLLEQFNCKNNYLMFLDLSLNIHLKHINCSFNNIEGIIFDQLTFLEYLNMENNRIAYFSETIIDCEQLKTIEYNNNPLHLSIPQTIFINHVQNKNSIKGITADNENVHDSTIIQTTNKSLYFIMDNKDYVSDNSSLEILDTCDSISDSIKNTTKTYCDSDEKYGDRDLTFKDIFNKIFPIVVKLQAYKSFEDEMADSENLCFVGRISRLVNCLNGYIKEVNINISWEQDLNNIASHISQMDLDSSLKKNLFLKSVLEKYPNKTEKELKIWTIEF